MSNENKYCIECTGDGYLSGEWEDCPRCFGTGRNLTDEERRIYRVRKAEREARYTAIRLDKAERDHASASKELTAAQAALFEAAQLAQPASVPSDLCPFRN